MPRGAKRVGAGWQARGTIVQCKNTPMRGLSGFGAANGLGFISGEDMLLIMGVAAGMGAGVGALSSYFAKGDVAKGAMWGGATALPAFFALASLGRDVWPRTAYFILLFAPGVAGTYASGGAKKIEGVLTAALVAGAMSLTARGST
jgi:hypothetical protein